MEPTPNTPSSPPSTTSPLPSADSPLTSNTMPNVRFADEDEVVLFFEYAATPSVLYRQLDSGSKTSSPTSYQQKDSTQTVNIAEVLRFGSSHIDWDLRTPAEKSGTPKEHLKLAATVPELPSLVLICSFLPWKTFIRPKMNGEFVTVGDVLAGLAHDLTRDVTKKEAQNDSMTIPRDVFEAAYSACSARVASSKATNKLKRIDFLAGAQRCQWRGLNRDDDGNPLNQFEFVVAKSV